jgi:CRISPR system Cascade subunit CasD
MNVLLLRFDAPLLSFGGTAVDAKNVTDEMPSRSMITGLLGNALGYEHRDVVALSRLQQRLRVSARRDREGVRMVDFQTVDLGHDFLAEGWTTWGQVEGREGGTAASGTHIRYRHHLADAIYTIAVTVESADEPPTLENIEAALNEPARPLFLGRKACLPSVPISMGIVEAESAIDALRVAPLGDRRRYPRQSLAADERRECLVRVHGGMSMPTVPSFRERAVTENRDWPNQIHVGRSVVHEALMECGASAPTENT